MPPSKNALAFRARFAQRDQTVAELVGRQHHIPKGPWFSAESAATFYDFRSVNAFRVWAYRHGIVTAHFGRCARYSRADIDAVMKVKGGNVSEHKRSLREVSHAR